VGSSRFVLTIFVILQVADGLITFGAVSVFGPGAEANPVLQTWMQLLGPGVTLLTAKTMACAGAFLLYCAGRERTLVALTTLLVSLGVGPWLAVLRDLAA
jgi:uncharacterized membrane protein SpoIIM required for sporulation